MRPHCLSVQSVPSFAKQLNASKFLATLKEAAYEREAAATQARLLRELVNSLSSGDLLLMPTDDVWHLDKKQREATAIAKLDKLIALVVRMRAKWIASPLGAAPWNADRSLGPLEGDMTVSEAYAASRELLGSMTEEKRAEYAFCFQASGSKQFLFALLRQPSFFKAEGLEKLLEEWANIKNSSEYKEAIEKSKRRTELQTKQKAELQNLRMQINRKRQKGEGTQDLLLELHDKEKSYNRGNKGPLGPTPPPRNAHNPRRAASARRPLRLRLEKEDNPRSPTGSPRLSSSGRSHEITPELDADWTLPR